VLDLVPARVLPVVDATDRDAALAAVERLLSR